MRETPVTHRARIIVSLSLDARYFEHSARPPFQTLRAVTRDQFINSIAFAIAIAIASPRLASPRLSMNTYFP
jgi:hypothetical protein